MTAPHPPLRQIYFYLTEGCNLACRHCWLAPKFDPDGTRHPVLPVESFETAVREGKALGMESVKLTGGEPLLHPEIRRILDIVRGNGLRVTVETNGVLATPALAAAVASCGKPSVAVSIDGADAETHEAIRGIPGSFAGACRGVRTFVDAGIRPQVIFSVMRRNVAQVDGIVRFAESLGASSVKFNIIQPTARGERLREADEAPGVEEILALARRVEREVAPSTSLRLHFDVPLAFRPLGKIASGERAGRCGILGIVGVLPTGRYALCGIGNHLEGLVFGTVGVDPLERIWHGDPVLRSIREGLPSRMTGICGRCLMRARCLGSCLAQNVYRSGDLFAPFWFCEEAARLDLFPVSRLE